MVRGDVVSEPDETIVIALNNPSKATFPGGEDHGHGHGHHHRRRRIPAFDCGGRSENPLLRVSL